MTKILALDASSIVPDKATVFQSLNMPAAGNNPKHEAHVLEALETFLTLARPSGIVKELSVGEFANIVAGEGLNESPMPVEGIYPKAVALALYAATVGKELSEKIGMLFQSGEEVRALFLDTVASRSAENAGERIAEIILREWKEQNVVPKNTVILGYSPGYCGWHISGQKKLFGYLKPEVIGITLNRSCLMEPLKSISGILIAGGKEIFFDENVYPFCEACANPTCQERARRIEAWSF